MVHALNSERTLAWFTLFKYAIYAILVVNIGLFLFDDWNAARTAYGEDFGGMSLIGLFPSTIDTAAWVILLLLFELETWVISDATLKRKPVQYSLSIGRLLAGSVIVYSLYGYWLIVLQSYALTPLADPAPICEMAARGYQLVESLGEYSPIAADQCQQFGSGEWLVHHQQLAVGPAESWQLAQRLAWLDVVNATVWVLVVIVLETDVWLQLRGRLEGVLMLLSRYIKALLYALLAVAVVAWVVMADWLSAWDAAIWLIAFVFIEMNILQWNAEISEQVAG